MARFLPPHVRPHLWSELDTLAASKRRSMHRHADACAKCGAARERINELGALFAEIRESEPPEIEWEHVGARLHWSRSLERRTGQRPALSAGLSEESIAAVSDDSHRRPWHHRGWVRGFAGAAIVTAVATAAVTAVSISEDTNSISDNTPSEGSVAALAPMAVSLSESTPMSALVVASSGETQVDGDVVMWNEPITVGQRIETGEGRVVVQFARGGGFALGTSSAVTLRSFDSRSIELVLEGTLEVLVTRRATDQQFVVVAGERTVSVRGTAFRVKHRAGDLDVACEHGRVEVADRLLENSEGAGAASDVGNGVVAVRGGERLVAANGDDLSKSVSALALSAEEADALRADLALPLLAAWSDPISAIEASSTLSILAHAGAAVSVDGVRVGAGDMKLRLLAGRHEVAVQGSAPWAGGRWVDLVGGPSDVRIIAANHGDERVKARRRVRGVQLRLALRDNQVRMQRCVSRLVANGVAKGAFVVFDVKVNRDGTVGAVSVSDENVGNEVRRCVLGVVGALVLPRGPRASARARWDF